MKARLNCRVFSQYHLSPEGKNELETFRPKVTEDGMPIQSTALEEWLLVTVNDLRLKLQRLFPSSDSAKISKSEDEKELGKEIIAMLNDAVNVFEDAGTHSALAFISSEYIALNVKYAREETVSDALAAIQYKFMHSGLFQKLTSNSESVDEDGFVVDVPTSKQLQLVKALHRKITHTDDCGDNFKCIVFMKSRQGVKRIFDILTGTLYAQYFRSEVPGWEEKSTSMLKPKTLVGQRSRTGGISESPGSLKETMSRFKGSGQNSYNLLVTTSVAEEGLDFPACNVVIRMDGVHSGVSLAQSRGRVRTDGHFMVMYRTDTDEELAYHKARDQEDNSEEALKWDSGNPSVSNLTDFNRFEAMFRDDDEETVTISGSGDESTPGSSQDSEVPQSPEPVSVATPEANSSSLGGCVLKIKCPDGMCKRVSIASFSKLREYLQGINPAYANSRLWYHDEDDDEIEIECEVDFAAVYTPDSDSRTRLF
mmetsp:Transcript_2493/g.4007  ORF Transcript_2493/g.4007 Transcript_2493/m.4007 type:complete len:481 (-) Transcript_2493:394-1836(-)